MRGSGDLVAALDPARARDARTGPQGAVLADPKPDAPTLDRDARKLARLGSDECAACGHSDRGLSVHHVMGAEGHGRRRDDDPRNLLVLCGDGITFCHGGFHLADPDTRRRIGRAILRRPETVAYVLERLGGDAGRDYLRRRYLILPGEIPAT